MGTTFTGSTPPPSPTPGQLWYWTEATTGGGCLFIWYNDGNSTQWVPAVAQPAAGAIPTGTVNDFAGAAAPTGWLLCNGQLVSRTAFAALFAVIGTAYGVGDGTTTFAVPDLCGRVVAGLDNMGSITAKGRIAAAITLGWTGGLESVLLDANTLPVHTHGISDPTHVHAIADPGHSHGIGDPAHSHWYDGYNNGCGCNGGGATIWSGGNYTAAAGTGIWTGGAGTGVYNDYRYTGVTAANAGGGLAHENKQPTMAMNKIIKT